MAVVERHEESSPERYVDRGTEGAYGPAAMDIRLPVRWVWAALVFAIIGGFVAMQLTNWIGQVNYSADIDLLGVQFQNTSHHGIRVEDQQLTSILQLARSDAYMLELIRRSGVSVDLATMRTIVNTTRPHEGGILNMHAISPDKSVIDAVAPQLIPTLNVLIDQSRADALPVLGQNGRDTLDNKSPDYRGPMYLDPFRGQASRGQAAAPTQTNMFLGAIAGVMVLFVVALASHARPRVTSRERLDEVLGLRQVATVPRMPILPRRRFEHYLKGVALAVDGICARGAQTVGLVGSGIPRTRANLALALAVAMGETMERNVVLVDLDVERGALSRRLGLVRRFPRKRVELGVSDVIEEGLAPQTLVTRVPRWRIPRPLRRLAKRSDSTLYAIGAGTRVGERTFGDEGAATELLGLLAEHAIVIVMLPRVPGPSPVQGILNILDVSVLTVLDGWSELPAAQGAAAVVHSTAAGRDGFLLLEN